MEPALQQLNEVREQVDGDIAEMVDALANLIVLQQDFDRPMLGAKVTLYEDELVEREAIVIEGNVAHNAPDGQLWDPNTQEYAAADDYPLGTVNLVVNDSHDEFSDSYCTDVDVYTSITPANGEPSPYTYTPGW
jgi:hypothetical protein